MPGKVKVINVKVLNVISPMKANVIIAIIFKNKKNAVKFAFMFLISPC